MYFNLDSLQVGDEVATCVDRYGRTHVRLVKVVKVTKTTVSVLGAVAQEGNGVPEVYNKSNGYERGSRDSWHRKFLISKSRYDEISLQQHIHRQIVQKVAKREEMIQRLHAARYDAAAFAKALEALNQQEYCL